MPLRHPRLLLFDPYSGGHHAEHIRHIVKAWKESKRAGHLVAAVSPKLLSEHPDLEAHAFDAFDRGVSFRRVEGYKELGQTDSRRPTQISRINRDMFGHVVETYKPERVHALFYSLRGPQTDRRDIIRRRSVAAPGAS